MLLDFDEFIVTSNYHPYDIWGNTKDYDPIMERFTVSSEMKKPIQEKDDEEKLDALELLRIKNKGFE